MVAASTAPATPAPHRQHGSMSTATSRSQRCFVAKRRHVPFRANHRSACRFLLDGRMEASHLHAPVKSEPQPVLRDCGATTALQKGTASYSESSFCAKSHSGGFWGAVGPLTAARRTVPRSVGASGGPAPAQSFALERPTSWPTQLSVPHNTSVTGLCSPHAR